MTVQHVDPHHLPFMKLVSSGQGYIAIDGRYPLEMDLVQFAIAACNGKSGIGSDYVLVIGISQTADFKLQCFAPDGTFAAPGAGVRAAAKFLHQLNLLNSDERSLVFETKSENVRLEIIGAADKVRIDMGSPAFESPLLPSFQGRQGLLPLMRLDGVPDPVVPVAFSDAHCVLFTSGVDYLDIAELAPKIETHELFPKGAHVEFAEVVDPERLKLRIWAHGRGEVVAHDEALCAVMAAAIHCRKAASTAHLKTPEEEFEAYWNSELDRIYLTGSTQECFSGEVDVARLIACTERTKLN